MNRHAFAELVMNCRTLGSILIAGTFFGGSGLVQAKPDFTGKWKLLPDRTHLGGNGGCPDIFDARGLGQEFTATQTAAALTIERMQGPPANQKLTQLRYTHDGSESTNRVPLGGEASSKASWSGQKLAIGTISVFDTGGGDVAKVTMKTTQILSFDPTGLLSVATTLGCRDHVPETTTMVYRREVR